MSTLINKISPLVAAGLLAISPIVLADQKFDDDLVVVGSLCVGFDCVNGEAFGFDTIRLKENNLRVKFIDSSSSSSFPTRDWQITVNDTANGGINWFGIEDLDAGTTPFTILAGAANNSLYISSNGNIGMGTITPLVDLNIKAGNSPTLRLEQDTSSGFAEQTWDLGGNEANFFIRDVSNGSALPFRIMPSAPNGSLHIAADGDIGFETTTPDGQFDIAHSSDANNHAVLVHTNSWFGINIDNSYAPKGLFDVQTTGGNSRLVVDTSGNVGISAPAGVPSGRFDIRGLDMTTSYFNVDASGDVGIGTIAPAGRFQINSANGATPYMSVSADGEVGIGTDTPRAGSIFNIKQQTGNLITYMESIQNLAVQMRIMSDSPNRRWLAVNSANVVKSQMIFGDENIQFAGAVSTTDLYGTFSATGLVVNGPISTTVSGQVHPDYVFEADYELMSLPTLKAFIQQNHHLPEVPSKDDVAENGLDMTAMQILLLKKVEELTLYVIQQQEAIDVLNHQLHEAEKK